MMRTDEIRMIVREHYGRDADQQTCCGEKDQPIWWGRQPSVSSKPDYEVNHISGGHICRIPCFGYFERRSRWGGFYR